MGLFDRLKEGLNKTRNSIVGKIDKVLVAFGKVDEELFEELEEIMVMSDIGINTTNKIINNIKIKVREKRVTDPMEVRNLLKDEIKLLISDKESKLDISKSPMVIVVVGVNGVGKTTSIGKMAKKFKDSNKKVIIAAADTFRAAAIDQLEIWSKRAGVEIVKHGEGCDPAAVVFDAIAATKARRADILICDTAGRLHTKKNLMEELRKIGNIINRELPEAPKEVLLVLDATTGQNAIAQAKTFKEVVDISGIVLTKLDGTAKGGIVIAIKDELDIPIKYIGVGESVEDLQEFNATEFVEALFS